ncbi:poly-gamma-glutamate hydrolase family protein [Streptomyces sp. G1]|uniref:poly-gamma-glutamate hydrolase family protein n=1 Tax=Streptomyces sp. G1 TaxID=361572 RepID=UPI00202E2C7F|nr:poly-gamma-glutamate hydrolase family protein [Streptomyces sp. G1]MCM1967787.1 poly-gamma-glutamate hydrolase family protein [Streptomyces sp. G1]
MAEYPNWAALAAAEKEGSDYRITTNGKFTELSHIAIHAGGIEPGSGELAKAVAAGKPDHALFCMEGLKSADNGSLHITSTHFDHPTCLKVQAAASRTISYHGYSGDEEVTHIGGLDIELGALIGARLLAAGFQVDFNPSEDIAGVKQDNIANRNRARAGVQLELTRGMRNAFFPDGKAGAADRNDPAKRTPTFARYVAAVQAAIADLDTLNPARVWDGSKWATGKKYVWDGAQWVAMPAVLFWDGTEWQPRAPAPREFAAFSGSSKGNYKDTRYPVAPLPAGVRVGDYVVSICANQRGFPKLIAPAGHLPQIVNPATDEMSFAVVCWPYTGKEGDVVWDLGDSPQAACMNLVYRYGDAANQSVTPVSGMQLHQNVDKIPLMPSKDFTSVFVALAMSHEVSSYQWPEGVQARSSVLGKFGSYEISAFAADTPGAGASLGALRLNTTVDAAAMYLVTIPGGSDGKPTWILGDSTASVLGRTTYLL